MEEKRKGLRIDVNWPITVFVDDRQIEGKTVNISLQGICIQCKDPIPSEEHITVSIFPPGCKPINIVGEIAWSDSYALDMKYNNVPVCIGLSFIEISLKDQHILKEIIEIPVE